MGANDPEAMQKLPAWESACTPLSTRECPGQIGPASGGRKCGLETRSALQLLEKMGSAQLSFFKSTYLMYANQKEHDNSFQ